jgi:starch synthase
MVHQNHQKTLKVLFLAAEAAPLVKVGGLGDVSGALPVALRGLASPDWEGPPVDIRLVLPFHDEINRKIKDPRFVASFMVDHPGEPLAAKAFETRIDQLPVYLIEGPPILPDEPVYSTDPLLDGEKYTFFSLAAIKLIEKLNWIPDIVHANDWHTATSLYVLKRMLKDTKPYKHTRSVLTVHNLPFMGKDAEEALIRYGIPRSRDKRLPQWATLFPLPLGLLAADRIVAVSPGYAQEILTPEFGCGLQDFLSTRQEALCGILNGLDEESWDPANDKAVPVNFDSETIDARWQNKMSLLQDLELKPDPQTPLFIIISRMDQQKGIDIAIAGLRECADLDWQLVILGTGDPLLESACRSLEAEFPDRVRAIIRFDGNLARRMYAAGDVLLMPSRYEPCGLTQMIAMRYGCLPLARATGGLKDTITDADQAESATGFLFTETTPQSFAQTIKRSSAVFLQKSRWRTLQVNGMRQKFGWNQSAAAYARIYQTLTEQIP